MPEILPKSNKSFAFQPSLNNSSRKIHMEREREREAFLFLTSKIKPMQSAYT